MYRALARFWAKAACVAGRQRCGRTSNHPYCVYFWELHVAYPLGINPLGTRNRTFAYCIAHTVLLALTYIRRAWFWCPYC